MRLNNIQEKIKEFNEIRGWNSPEQIKDLLLNLTEEIGEFWNKIKWIDAEAGMKVISDNY